MQPGDAIDEPALCERFGASRTPVREALLLLVAKGLVEIVPRSGIYVRRLDARELVAMMEGLAELEGVLARLAATRIHAQLRERLQAALAHTAACAQAQDAQGYVQANMQLHELIYEASGNDFIVEQTRLLRLRITPYRGRMFESRAGWRARSRSTWPWCLRSARARRRWPPRPCASTSAQAAAPSPTWCWARKRRL